MTTDADQSWLEAMPFAATLGARLVRAEPGEVRARLEWHERLCTAGGVLHGGAVMGLADSTGGLCAYLNLPPGAAGTTTVESKTNFLAGVRAGYVEAVSRPLHSGRTIVVVDTEVLGGDGRLVARVTQSQLVLQSR